MNNQLIVVSFSTLLLTSCSSCFPSISPEAMAIVRENVISQYRERTNAATQNTATVNTENTGTSETWYPIPEYLDYTPTYNGETQPFSDWERKYHRLVKSVAETSEELVCIRFDCNDGIRYPDGSLEHFEKQRLCKDY